MATTPIWVPLVVAFIGLGGVMLTQYLANRREDTRSRREREREDVRWHRESEREDVRWHRERERERTRWTREDAARSKERTQQRLADSYLEVLRIVEREGQWTKAQIENVTLATEEKELEADPKLGRPVPQFQRAQVPELDITDRPTAAAHLAAFGSDNARRLYQAWLSATQEIRNELWYLDDVAINVEELWLRDLRRLRDELQPNERRARQALADAIAKELDDHRKAGAGDHPSDVG